MGGLFVWRLPVMAAALLPLTACGGSAAQDSAPQPVQTHAEHSIGLFTTLPIYWGGAGDISSILNNGSGESSWVRGELEKRGAIVPLDLIDSAALDGLDMIVLAQPRPLSPSENVALDNWVRGGGKVLIFADPMLTEHSEYALGDPRRPHDMVVLSPILARWGLELRFDEDQHAGRAIMHAGDLAIPVNLRGSFALRDGGEGADCTISAEGLIARCGIGEGEAVLMADAALLESDANTPGNRAALGALLDGF